jgi:NADPH:quinone reductase-like Zn-dependent oxidoreductase
MKLYRLIKPDLDSLVVMSEADPLPGPTEVLVQIKAASLNYKDLLFVKSAKDGGIELSRPTIPLSDAAGEVVALGSGVTDYAVGDRVTATVLHGWLEGPIPADAISRALGAGRDGVLCEYRTFDQADLIKLPAKYSFEEGATLPIAALTAWNAMEHVKPGQRVLILGTGGVALFALQFARAVRARVIITSSSDEKIARAKSMGAEEGINYRASPEWQKEVLSLTDGCGVDHVVETVSGTSLQRSVAATAIGGHVHLVGLLDRGKIDPYDIQYRAVNVHGIRMGPKILFESMIQCLEKCDIYPVIDRQFAFADARQAYEYLKSGSHFGKVVIVID